VTTAPEPGTAVALAGDPALLAQGWERRFMAVGERVEESVALYRDLGYEVRVERPLESDLREECGDCRLALELFRVVYTRRMS